MLSCTSYITSYAIFCLADGKESKMVNNQIKIHFARADEYVDWTKNLQNFEEIVPYIEKLNLRVYLIPHNKPLSDISYMFTSDYYLFHHRPLESGEQVNYSLFHPASGKYLNFKDTLYNQGVNNNDVVVIKLYIWNPNAFYLLRPVAFIDELIQIFNTNHPNSFTVSIEDKNSSLAKILESGKDENPLYAILLYTEEDINIAKYVRSYYNELSKLSGKTHVFVFEDRAEGKESSQYWSKHLLNIDEYIGWNALGLTRTKPYDKAQIYELCDIFEIPKDKVPCILFFNNLDLNEKKFIVLEFPKDEKLTDFFRHVFTVCDKVVNVSPKKRMDVLTYQFRKDKVKRIISSIVKSGVIKDVLKKAVGI